LKKSNGKRQQIKYLVLTSITYALITQHLNAGTVTKVDIDPIKADVNKTVTLKLQFSSEEISCGLKLDWGNGRVERIRVGKDQQLKPPYLVEGSYSTAGNFQIAISGELIPRGLRTLGPCDVNFIRTINIIDPVIEARLAEEKAERERIEQAAKEAEQAEKKRLAEEAASRKERALAEQKERREAEERERAAKAEREKYVPVKSKRYVAIFKCEEHAWAENSQLHVRQAMEYYKIRGMDGVKLYAKGLRHCAPMFQPVDAKKVPSLEGSKLYKSEGAADYIVYTVSNGFQTITSGNSSTMLPTWTLYAIIGN
jgi:hypothetical protein